MSTLLSDLDSIPATGGGDEDFVQNILREMNGGGGGGGGGGGAGSAAVVGANAPPPMPPTLPPPAIGSQHPMMIQAPNPNTVAPHVMDVGPATAHMIGNSQPTAADFAQLLGSAKVNMGAMAGAADAGAADMRIGYGGGAAAATPSKRRSFIARMADEFRPSIFVAMLVFVSSLPVANFLFAHYLPSMVKPTGELTPVGLLIKSLMAGAAFWTLQRVVVPLLTT
jgi:hypothetical protein